MLVDGTEKHTKNFANYFRGFSHPPKQISAMYKEDVADLTKKLAGYNVTNGTQMRIELSKITSS